MEYMYVYCLIRLDICPGAIVFGTYKRNINRSSGDDYLVLENHSLLSVIVVIR